MFFVVSFVPFFLFSRKVFSSVGGVNVVLVCFRLFWSCFSFFDRIFDARSMSFCLLLQDMGPSAVSTVSLQSSCLFPRPCGALVHGVWPARAMEVSLLGQRVRAWLHFSGREGCLPGGCWWSIGFQGLSAFFFSFVCSFFLFFAVCFCNNSDVTRTIYMAFELD